MTYLMFFRSVTYFGLPQPSGHLNMILMVMVLKIIGFSFERDSVLTKLREVDKQNGDKKQMLTKVEDEIKNISFINLFHYCFNYIGLLTGERFGDKLESENNLATFSQVPTSRTKRSSTISIFHSP